MGWFSKRSDTESSDSESINKPFTTPNTPFYDKESVCSVHFLDKEWIKQKCKKFTKLLKDNPNRALSIPVYERNSILAEMQKLRISHLTHVYKYTCKTTLKQKYCNAEMIKKTKGTTKYFEHMFGDIVTEKWLYETAVGLRNRQD